MNEANNVEIKDNFDELTALYAADSAGFEKKRLELIQSVIDQAPEGIQRRLTGLQWQIDSEIKLAKTPMEGCSKVYQMMMDSIYGGGGLQEALNFTDNEISESIPNASVVNIKDFSKTVE